MIITNKELSELLNVIKNCGLDIRRFKLGELEIECSQQQTVKVKSDKILTEKPKLPEEKYHNILKTSPKITDTDCADLVALGINLDPNLVKREIK